VRPPPPRRAGIRTFNGIRKSKAISYFLIAKGMVDGDFRDYERLANRMRSKAASDLQSAQDRRLAKLARNFQPVLWLGHLILPRETVRLEQALRRSNELAVRQHAQQLFGAQVRTAYRNSRTTLVEKLRQEARAAAFAKEPRLADEEARLRTQAAAAAAAKPDRKAVDRLKHGMELLRDLRPADAALLQPWRGKEQELLDRLLAATKAAPTAKRDPLEQAALRAGHLGHLVEKEATTPHELGELPAGLAHLSEELQMANRRFAAAGAGPIFVARDLERLSGAELGSALRRLRDEGFLSLDSAWALRASAARPVAMAVRKDLDELLRQQRGRTP
jgi:hypothetical protein